jgi:hypothetical protein
MSERADFTYFRAPIEEVADYAGITRCSLCLTRGPCVGIPERTGAVIEPPRPPGCFDCLQAGRFAFDHMTEAGLLTGDGLLDVFDEPEPETVYAVGPDGAVVDVTTRTRQRPEYRIDAAAQAELRRTPQFSTWQDPMWLCHCNDFMVFLGHWTQDSFEAAAPDGDGRSVYLSMAEEDWDRGRWPEGGTLRTNVDAEYLVFRCRHCGVHRGYWDLS